MAYGEYGDWNTPGTAPDGFTGQTVNFRWQRGPSRFVTLSFILSGPMPETMNDNDWQAFLDHLAGMPGMIWVKLEEAATARHLMEPTVGYEPLPPPEEN